MAIMYFTEIHRKTSNFDMCLLNFISICHFCFIQKIIHHLKINWPRFSLPKFCRSSIYVITIVIFSNRYIENLFNFPQRTSMDLWLSAFSSLEMSNVSKTGLYDEIFISKEKCPNISGSEMCVMKYHSVCSHNQVSFIRS